MGKAFECKMCGECCYGEGGIFMSDEEVSNIARFLNMETGDFVFQYCETRQDRLYLKTGPTNFCIFFDRKRQCLIHPVKPERCVQWPFFAAIVNDEENWEMAKYACPGINPECSFEEFVAQSKK
jgi:Fe-S-cluster containining protein